MEGETIAYVTVPTHTLHDIAGHETGEVVEGRLRGEAEDLRELAGRGGTTMLELEENPQPRGAREGLQPVEQEVAVHDDGVAEIPCSSPCSPPIKF